MKIIKSINKLHNDVNFKANIGFVPTMGSLHKGHVSLIESAKKKCDINCCLKEGDNFTPQCMEAM